MGKGRIDTRRFFRVYKRVTDGIGPGPGFVDRVMGRMVLQTSETPGRKTHRGFWLAALSVLVAVFMVFFILGVRHTKHKKLEGSYAFILSPEVAVEEAVQESAVPCPSDTGYVVLESF